MILTCELTKKDTLKIFNKKDLVSTIQLTNDQATQILINCCYYNEHLIGG